MNSNVNLCDGAPRLSDATPNELGAVCGGHNYSFYDRATGTGVIFRHDGLVAVVNGKEILDLGPGGKVNVPKV